MENKLLYCLHKSIKSGIGGMGGISTNLADLNRVCVPNINNLKKGHYVLISFSTFTDLVQNI